MLDDTKLEKVKVGNVASTIKAQISKDFFEEIFMM